jgi:hypothetical protein
MPLWPAYIPITASSRRASRPLQDQLSSHTMSEITDSGRDAQSGRFLSGCKPGPGRAKGSRNRLAENFLAAFADDFEKHGAAFGRRLSARGANAVGRGPIYLY